MVSGDAGRASVRLIAQGEGWSVSDVICTSGPDDRSFEEQHRTVSIGIVAAGTFQYRTGSQKEVMAPGSILLGNPGQSFECDHEHGTGDRCIAFEFAPEFFDDVPRFRALRIPPQRATASLIARACAALAGAAGSWEELAIEVAGTMARIANDVARDEDDAPPHAIAKVTRAIRAIERHADAALPLQRLAQQAGLSPYHFLRTFTRVAGVTPHQFGLRARVREAAMRLALEKERVLDVALDSGFGDLSNFNRTFRAELGVTPRAFRRAHSR